MKFPGGIFKTIAELAVKEVIGRVTDNDTEVPDDPQEFALQVAEVLVDSAAPDASEFAAEIIMELMSEERSDEFLEILMDKIELPMMAERMLQKALDSQLPEVIRDPMLEMVGYEVIAGNLVKKV